MSAQPATTTSSRRTVETVAGLMAAAAIAASAVAVAYRPFRIAPFAIVLALIAAGIGGRHSRLATFAVGVGALCLFVGLILAVATRNPFY